MDFTQSVSGRFAGAGAVGAGDLIQSVSGRWAGAGEVGRLTDPVAPPLICGAISGPQLPELCDTTFGAAPLPDDVICILRTQTPLPDSVETNE